MHVFFFFSEAFPLRHRVTDSLSVCVCGPACVRGLCTASDPGRDIGHRLHRPRGPPDSLGVALGWGGDTWPGVTGTAAPHPGCRQEQVSTVSSFPSWKEKLEDLSVIRVF